jgi:AraC-like DNA-binding protein
MLACYDSHTPLIPALHQPALLADLVQEHGVDPAAWLAASGVPAAALLTQPRAISPAEWLRLMAHADRLLAAPDTAFVYGRRLLPGHHGAASHALQQAGCLLDALQTLVRHTTRLSPLLTPRLLVERDEVLLVWRDAVGLGAQRAWVVDMAMAAVAAMAEWLGGQPLPWTFCFNRTAPRRVEQHQAYLGTALRFGCHVDGMVLPREHLERPWPRATQPGAAQARQAAERAAAHEAGHEPTPTTSLLGALHQHLQTHLHQAPSLEGAAQALGTSAATLKRRLAAEGTHFQAELDLARGEMALYLFRYRHADNGDVAQALGFHDVPNFRRAFKRWAGQTPQGLRLALAL